MFRRAVTGVIIQCVAAWMFLSFPSQSFAVMLGLSTDELTTNSQSAVIGKVGNVKSYWNKDRTKIMTSAEVTVEEPVKGEAAPGEKITVEYEGGELDGLGYRVSDSVVMNPGEQVLLFLKPAADSPQDQPSGGTPKARRMAQKVVGKAQGKYSIGRDGIARKRGFSISGNEEAVDNDIPIGELVEKIRRRANQ